jgi:hypothetical protein
MKMRREIFLAAAALIGERWETWKQLRLHNIEDVRFHCHHRSQQSSVQPKTPLSTRFQRRFEIISMIGKIIPLYLRRRCDIGWVSQAPFSVLRRRCHNNDYPNRRNVLIISLYGCTVRYGCGFVCIY